MIKLLSVDGDFFIVRIRDMFMIRSNGDKTLVYVNGLERPIVIGEKISNVIEDLVRQGIFKNMKKLVYSKSS